MGDAIHKAQFDGFACQHPQSPMVVAIRNGAAGDSNQIGCLGSREGLAVALLAFILEDCP